MRITVDALLLYPFHSRTRQQKIECILQGKPRPALDRLVSVEAKTPSSADSMEGNNTKFVIIFDKASYDHVEWLTGCDERQALFCWPCILFRSSQNYLWSKTGLTDLSNLGESIKQHERNLLHIQAMLDFQLFANAVKIDRPAAPLENKETKQNIEIAKRIIDVICYLVSQQKTPRIRSQDKNSLKVEDCLDSLHFLRDYDVLQTNLIDYGIEKIQQTPKIIANMIEAVNSTVRKAIQKDLNHSTYVSVILSEHSTERTKSQISTVLRYLRNGEVCERFIGFNNEERLKTPKMIYHHILNVINDFRIHQRVIAYSIDGTTLAGISGLYDVKHELKRLNRIHFVPCHFHDLDDVLLKSLSFSDECNLFLKNIMIMKSYFEEGANVRLEFNNFREMDDNSPEDMQCDNFQEERCSNYSALFNTIKTHKLSIKESFDKALAEDGKLADSDVVQIKAIHAFLADSKNNFQLEIFSKLFDFVAPLVEAFKSPFSGLAFDTDSVESVLKSFDDEFEPGAVECFLDKIFQDYVDPATGEKLQPSNKKSYCKLYEEVADCMKNQIRFRFENASQLSFCQILDLERSAKSLNAEHVQTLIANYGQVFDYALLDKEIKLLVTNKSAVSTSVHGLYKFFVTSGLGRSFKNLNRLCELVLTLPSTIPDITNRSARTKLDIINAWSHAAIKQHSRDVTFLCIEQDYLKELKRTKTFYDDVISEFREKSKTLEIS